MIMVLDQGNALTLYVNPEDRRWELDDVAKHTKHLTGDVFPNVEFRVRDDNTGRIYRFYGYIENAAEDAGEGEYDHQYLINRAGQYLAKDYTFLGATLTTDEIPQRDGFAGPGHLLVQPGVYLDNVDWDAPLNDDELLCVYWDSGETWYFPIVLQFPKDPIVCDEMREYHMICRLLRGETYATDVLREAVNTLINECVLTIPDIAVHFEVTVIPAGDTQESDIDF